MTDNNQPMTDIDPKESNIGTDLATDITPPAPQSWWQRLFNLKQSVTPHIDGRTQLTANIRLAHQKGIIVDKTLGMIEGVLQIENLQSRDIMLSRSQITFIQRDDSFEEIVRCVLKTGHSRYPVIDENRNDIEGIIHVKDLLKYMGKEEQFNIDNILREVNSIPESQRLSHLLANFRKSHNHMAIVFDEYGCVSGLITIEDILEQIVGDIDDEYDVGDKVNIQSRKQNVFTVNALTPITEFNDYFSAQLPTEQFDTIGGLVTHEIGKIPQQGEILNTVDFEFHVLSSNGRRIQLLEVRPTRQIIIHEATEKQVA